MLCRLKQMAQLVAEIERDVAAEARRTRCAPRALCAAPALCAPTVCLFFGPDFE